MMATRRDCLKRDTVITPLNLNLPAPLLHFLLERRRACQFEFAILEAACALRVKHVSECENAQKNDFAGRSFSSAAGRFSYQ